jgi:putative spermidine/putrescine transport system ATP-binding protein
VDLHVEAGEFMSLLGPSGCGKTTTLRLIAGFEQPDDGSVLIGGDDVAHLPPYRRDVNTVFQSYALFPHLRVLENVAYGLKQRGFTKDERRARARAMLELVRLPAVETRKPKQLSGGQQQRVALARALVMEPQVLLLDEPLGALDMKVRRQLQIELKRIQETVGVTFVYVTHDQEEALAMSDRVAVMNHGRIEQVGTPREIYDRPATPFVADFIGETNFIEGRGETLAVRPERLQVSREGPRERQDEGLAGEVVTTMVIGPAVQCLVRADDGQELLVRQQRDGGESPVESLRAGDRVVGHWAEDAAFVLARERGGKVA